MYQWIKSKLTRGDDDSSVTTAQSLTLTSPLSSFKPSTNSSLSILSHLRADQDSIDSLSLSSLNKLDKTKFDTPSFLIISGIGLAMVRVLGYPGTLIKTRVQIPGSSQSSFVVLKDIIHTEGVPGLFRGLMLSLTHTLSRQTYFYLYELIRADLSTNSTFRSVVPQEHFFKIRDSFAAFSASALYQIIANPVDIVVQRIMVQRRAVMFTSAHPSMVDTAALPPAPPSRHLFVRWLLRLMPSLSLARDLLYSDGPLTFYRGFLASTILFSSSAAVWWGSFEYLLDEFAKYLPPSPLPDPSAAPSSLDVLLSPPVSQMYHSHPWLAQHLAAALSSMLSVVMTNPIDVCRTRLMVQCRRGDGMTASSAMKLLIREEGWGALWRGMVPRSLSIVPTSVMTMAVYQFSKLLSVEIKMRKEGVL